LAPQVVEGRTGRLFEPGDVDSLFAELRMATGDVAGLRRLAAQGLNVARGLTHWEMHRARWRILVCSFGAS
jgi:hypothetical protein